MSRTAADISASSSGREITRSTICQLRVIVERCHKSVIDLPHDKLLKVTTFAFYDLGPDDRFTRIRACSYARRYEDS